MWALFFLLLPGSRKHLMQQTKVRQALMASRKKKLLELSARQNGNQFALAAVDSLYIGADPISEFKKKAWADYASWLEGRTFESSEELQSQLQGIAANINQYGIINKVGFDRYQVKDLTYSLTKASAVGSSKIESDSLAASHIRFVYCWGFALHLA
jgi:hypothetical protein